MTRARLMTLVSVAILVLSASLLRGTEPISVERGKQALLARAYSPPALSLKVYQDAWRQWDTGAKEPPNHYTEAFKEHYGLAAAPYPNDGL